MADRYGGQAKDGGSGAQLSAIPASGGMPGPTYLDQPWAMANQTMALATSRTSGQPFALTARGDALGTEPGLADYSP
jgi:hypothetical protein